MSMTCQEAGRLGGLKGGLTRGPSKARTSDQARKAARVRWDRPKPPSESLSAPQIERKGT